MPNILTRRDVVRAALLSLIVTVSNCAFAQVAGDWFLVVAPGTSRVDLLIATRTMSTITFPGGVDAYLVGTSDCMALQVGRLYQPGTPPVLARSSNGAMKVNLAPGKYCMVWYNPGRMEIRGSISAY